MKKILIVDDEPRMLDLISLYLTPHNYLCKIAFSGKKAVKKLEHEVFDLVLLDIMMPEMDGWKTCRVIRQSYSVPIIMLTARDHNEDVVKGLKIGADDYISKPFDEEVLLARIESVLRRSDLGKSDRIYISGLVWDSKRYVVDYQNQVIPTTPKEFELLGLFLNYPQKVFTRDQLIESVWGFDTDTEGRTVDSHIRNLREKCRKAGFEIDQHLMTVWGVGYKWI
ncbi:response regulator transcription factor [Alkalihalobacillus sp. AL-G]|uniref:response regulator transcription factor n=1 Tax=Alkalihalobacillus sp. AL-G TaxID=2926399 RepID=UPI00272AA761|nr:response regulator transcription factor [Alkalihalobacillus sp. AL-G]WLD92013.1 response regulator transcription factor [Alkalihalobacillus sp. AL-G]